MMKNEKLKVKFFTKSMMNLLKFCIFVANNIN